MRGDLQTLELGLIVIVLLVCSATEMLKDSKRTLFDLWGCYLAAASERYEENKKNEGKSLKIEEIEAE